MTSDSLRQDDAERSALSGADWTSSIAVLRRACEAGAASALAWAGRLDKNRADADAARAMRLELRHLPVGVRVVAGEGEKDGVEHLMVGEVVAGLSAGIGLDLAVDPIEGTTNLAHGLPWALTVAAATPHGSMFETGPSLYMDKLIVPKDAARHIDPEADTRSRLMSLARAVGKSVKDLRVFVLDKPRHKGLALEIVNSGARVALYPAGDVVGTCAVALGEHFDAVMGIGGTPEGMLSACAVRALGGGFFGRFAPQRPDESEALARVGSDTTTWLAISDMIRTDRAVFCAAGISDSLLTPGIRQVGDQLLVSTLVVHGPMATVDRDSCLHVPTIVG